MYNVHRSEEKARLPYSKKGQWNTSSTTWGWGYSEQLLVVEGYQRHYGVEPHFNDQDKVEQQLTRRGYKVL